MKIKFINRFFLLGDQDQCPISLDNVNEIDLKNLAMIYKDVNEADQFRIFNLQNLKDYIGKRHSILVIEDPLTRQRYNLRCDFILTLNKKLKFNTLNWYTLNPENIILSNFISSIGLSTITLDEKKFFIDELEDINFKDFQGNSFLHLAVLKNDPEIIIYLIAKGINIEALNLEKKSALFLAVKLNYSHIFQIIIDQGARVDYFTFFKRGDNDFISTIPELRKSIGSLNLILFDIRNKDENFFNKITNGTLTLGDVKNRGCRIDTFFLGKNALYLAVKIGNLSIVRMLIENGANPNLDLTKLSSFRDGQLKSILSLSVILGNYEITKFLIEKGSDINKRDESNNTALHYAVLYCHDKIVDLLLNCGIDINATNSSGQTALHYVFKIDLPGLEFYSTNAQKKEHRLKLMPKKEEIIKLLLAKGIRTEILNSSGFSALDCACQKRELELIELLTNNLANTNIVNSFGRNPFHIICIYNNERNIDDTSLKIIELLLKKKIDINLIDKYGNSAIIYAINNDNKIFVKKLFELGVDPLTFKDKIFDQKRNCESLLGGCFGMNFKLIKYQCEFGLYRTKLSRKMSNLICDYIDQHEAKLRNNPSLTATGQIEYLQPSISQDRITQVSQNQAILISSSPANPSSRMVVPDNLRNSGVRSTIL